MSKMTDEQIKKALECCIKPTSDCDNCPYYGYDDDLQCFDMSKRDALDLINRQQKQLDNYSHNVRTMTKDFNEQYKIIKQQQAKIENLERVISYLEGVCESTPDKVRAEAIKEFAENLKYKFKGDNVCDFLFVRMAINNLVKEMVGEGK